MTLILLTMFNKTISIVKTYSKFNWFPLFPLILYPGFSPKQFYKYILQHSLPFLSLPDRLQVDQSTACILIIIP
jgi:hypothetical protein